jgi:adenylylsulfate kinase-like enzyme
VYLRVPAADLARRNQKGLYAGAGREAKGPVTGIDHAAKEPLAPDLIVDNHGGTTSEAAAEAIAALVLARGKVAP